MKRKFRVVKTWLQTPLYALMLLGGFVTYIACGKTPAFAYQSMIKLFCLTRGYSNDLLSGAIGVFTRRYRFSSAEGTLGNMSDRKVLAPIVSTLRERGYYLFDKRLPDELCDRLLQFATSHEAVTSPLDGQKREISERLIYNRRDPRAVRYEFRTQDLLSNPDIQKILADLSFVAVAQEYLGARPVVDVLSMWWLTGFSDRPDSNAAQYYHFDMDRPKWLKFFINITDVGAANGPHTFVAGSHRSGIIPRHLLAKGYARLTDEEIGSVFAKDSILEFKTPRGSILAEDTRGLHKGKHVEHGDRLMLQIQFSNCLFGGDYPKVSFDGAVIPGLEQAFRQFPHLYAAYL